ncbi:MAG: hypothetical protein K9G59_09635 [Caulobacter sp.]|nr:hypothetical protein [Caulobacter sp.]
MRLVFVPVVLALSLAACGKPEAGDATAGKLDDGAVAVAAGPAAATTAAVDLPDFAPVYPGSEVKSTATGIGDAKTNGGMAVFVTPDSPDQVLAFYRQKAKAAGLEVQLDADMGAARQFAASDEATGRLLQVIVAAQAGMSQVQVIWGMKRA